MKWDTHHVYTSGKRWSTINLFCLQASNKLWCRAQMHILPPLQNQPIQTHWPSRRYTDAKVVALKACEPAKNTISYRRRFLLIIQALMQMSLP